MSSDSPQPRTRAELRAMREAAEREAASRAAAEAPEAPEPTEVAEAPEAAAELNEPPEQPMPPAPLSNQAAASAEPTAPVAPTTSDNAAAPAEPAHPRDVPPRRPARPRDRRFTVALAAVLGILALVGAVFTGIALTQGPRLSDVQVDAAEAIDVSGSRAILTVNEALAPLTADQVTVEPAVPFTVDAAGRSIGVRFTVPLHDDTEYTVRVTGVVGAGGGPTADLSTTFRTPPTEVFLLERDAEGEDKIFRTDLAGDKAVPVFSADRINDFRATRTQLVATVEKDGASEILVMGRDGTESRSLTLPGEGVVTGIQVADRGGFVGYTYSDREISEEGGRASVLVTQRLDGTDEPRIMTVAEEEVGIAEWLFVPDSAAVLFVDFDGALALQDLSADAGVQALGTAMSIPGVSRGTYTAVVERTDGTLVQLNLADGSETPLPASEPDFGDAVTISPYPGGTLRSIVTRDDEGFPLGQGVIRVDDDGTATSLVEVGSSDTILQTCASPSGQYAAVVIAPNLVDNPYDDLFAALPQTMHTHLIDVATGEEMVVLSGFDISWCASAPGF